MTRFWVIAPYESEQASTFDTAWAYDRVHGVIAIGWREVGDPSRLTQDELRLKIVESYGPKNATLYTNMLWRFCNEIAPGDRVIARRGVKKAIGVGTVNQRAFYDAERGHSRVGDVDNWYPNFIGVDWQGFEKGFDRIVFPMQTLYEIDEARFREFTEGIEPTPPAGADSQQFYLEKYLQEFIVTNFSRIFDDLELVGEKYPAADAGEIDILAKDRTTGNFVVIELKKGRESDKVVGQALRYMGWVTQSLCDSGQRVRGLIICREPDPKLSYALAMVPAVDVKYYQVTFALSDG